MSVLSGIGSVLRAAVVPLYDEAVLHCAYTQPDGKGSYQRGFVPFEVRAKLGDYSDGYRAQHGIPDTDVRLTVALPDDMCERPDTDSHVTLQGRRYRVLQASRSASGAVWRLQAREIEWPTSR